MTAADRYRRAGVDLGAAEDAKARIASLVAGTRTSLSVGHLGAFGGMVRLPDGLRSPVLVMSTDGVGTKVLVAAEAGRFDTVGEDLVNHSVNDILVHGARPIAFQDYVAGAEIGVAETAAIVEGVARGCRAHGMTLTGGETAQMPGLYQPGSFDLAGTIVGVVEEDRAIHGEAIVPGDVLLGYAASGLHTNGYTLARRIIGHDLGLQLHDRLADTDQTVGDALLAVHRSYAAAVIPVLDSMHGMAHITGGGIAGNLVRILPDQVSATIETGSWTWPALFRVLQAGGRVSLDEMRAVFNLGIGFIAVLPGAAVARARTAASAQGIETYLVGEIGTGGKEVRFST